MTHNENNTDLIDSQHDQDRLQSEEIIIDMPEVKDIPGQEHIHPLPAGEMADTTISSSDEEGEGLLDNLNEGDVELDEQDKDVEMDSLTDVTPLEKELLYNAARFMTTEDGVNLSRAALDNTDDDGDPLNEQSSADDETGNDLDIPGSEEDDANEDMGEEDEENNVYSTAQK